LVVDTSLKLAGADCSVAVLIVVVSI